MSQIDIRTPQEHKLIGSGVDKKYDENPHTPLSVFDGDISAEEANEMRKRQKTMETIPAYWGIQGSVGNMTMEELNLDERSDHYGETVRDPILMSSDNDSKVNKDFTNRFPFKRGEPIAKI